ncbi:MAG: large conductance mechanosensitive channel protein MscL [Saprospiraceae bacterium]
MLKEFKDFAMKGNLIDIAIGLVMATAFGAVTSAFVDGVVMPLVSQIFQVGDMSGLKIVLASAEMDASGAVVKPESAIMYGSLLSAFINFIIIAFVMFYIIKGINSMKKKEEEAAPAPPAGPTQEELLAQIRDLLKK